MTMLFSSEKDTGHSGDFMLSRGEDWVRVMDGRRGTKSKSYRENWKREGKTVTANWDSKGTGVGRMSRSTTKFTEVSGNEEIH